MRTHHAIATCIAALLFCTHASAENKDRKLLTKRTLTQLTTDQQLALDNLASAFAPTPTASPSPPENLTNSPSPQLSPSPSPVVSLVAGTVSVSSPSPSPSPSPSSSPSPTASPSPAQIAQPSLMSSPAAITVPRQNRTSTAAPASPLSEGTVLPAPLPLAAPQPEATLGVTSMVKPPQVEIPFQSGGTVAVPLTSMLILAPPPPPPLAVSTPAPESEQLAIAPLFTPAAPAYTPKMLPTYGPIPSTSGPVSASVLEAAAPTGACQNVGAVLASIPEASQWLQLLQNAGADRLILSNPSASKTLLVPVNSAFGAAINAAPRPETYMGALIANAPDIVAPLAGYSVLPDLWPSEALSPGLSIVTSDSFNQVDITLNVTGPTTFLGIGDSATILQANIAACGPSVIHIIDQILLPFRFGEGPADIFAVPPSPEPMPQSNNTTNVVSASGG